MTQALFVRSRVRTSAGIESAQQYQDGTSSKVSTASLHIPSNLYRCYMANVCNWQRRKANRNCRRCRPTAQHDGALGGAELSVVFVFAPFLLCVWHILFARSVSRPNTSGYVIQCFTPFGYQHTFTDVACQLFDLQIRSNSKRI
jgi:hypothetical protein